MNCIEIKERLMNCIKNCGKCCGQIPFMKSDIDKLKEFERKKLIPKDFFAHVKLSSYEKLITDIIFKDERVTHMSSTSHKDNCCFLGSQKQCTIYKKRPEVCRLFGEIPALQCPIC